MGRPVTLITGASAGLGAEFARQCAKRGEPLALAARRRDRMEALAAELGGEVHIFEADLSKEGAAASLIAELAAEGLSVGTLINNAGFGLRGRFATMSYEDQVAMVELNVTTLTRLCRLVLPGMIERRRGGIVARGLRDGWCREQQQEHGVPTVYVTHDQEEAMTLASRIAVMDKGRIVQLDTPRALYEQPASRFFAAIFHICARLFPIRFREQSCIGGIPIAEGCVGSKRRLGIRIVPAELVRQGNHLRGAHRTGHHLRSGTRLNLRRVTRTGWSPPTGCLRRCDRCDRG